MLYVAREKYKGIWLVGYWDTLFTEGRYYDYAVQAETPEKAAEFLLSEDRYAFPGSVWDPDEGDRNLEPEWLVVEDSDPECRVRGLKAFPMDGLRLIKGEEVLAVDWDALEQAVDLEMGTELPFELVPQDGGYELCRTGDHALVVKW